MAGIDESRPFHPMRIAVLTVSDTRDEAKDKSGRTLVERLEAAGHELAGKAVIADDLEDIQNALAGWIADPGVDVVISTGGTGLMKRDVTPEAATPLFEKHLDGFSALMHMVSYRTVGTSTMQSRSTAGLANDTLIFVLPGSPGACRDAWDEILRFQLDSRHMPCNFTEILPRFKGGT